MPDVHELQQEARIAKVRADAAARAENDRANDPGKAKKWADIAAEADDPKRRDQEASQKHLRSPAGKAAREYAKDVLGEVYQTAIELRRRGLDVRDLDPTDRKELIQRIGEGVPERMAAELRKAATRMLDDPSGDMGQVGELYREGVLRAANDAPFTFSTPDNPDDDPAALAARIGRW